MANNRAVLLTDNQQDMIKRLIDTGLYSGPDEVISAGLQLLQDREHMGADFIAALEKDILVGLQSGPVAPMEAAEDLLKTFRQHQR